MSREATQQEAMAKAEALALALRVIAERDRPGDAAASAG